MKTIRGVKVITTMEGFKDLLIVSDCDIIISWNFKHIVNVKTIRGVKVITTMEGFKDLLIYQPTALLEEE